MKNGGLEWFWGLLGELLEAFGPQDGPKLKKTWKSDFVDPPQRDSFGSLFGTFSSLWRSWDLKMVVLGGDSFDINLLIKFWSKLEAVGRLKTLIICVRGCKNQVFGYVGFWIILDTILELILEPKMDPESHCDSLWTPSVTILGVSENRWNKNMKKGHAWISRLALRLP